MKKPTQYGIIGLGITGFSAARYCSDANIPFVAFDTREKPPKLAEFQKQYPQVPTYTGNKWPLTVLENLTACVVSPGVCIQHEAIQYAHHKGVEILGDIELFARNNTKPVIAITGSNGKSTVTALMGAMAQQAGKNVFVAGNIGTPVLDALTDPTIDLIVLELSSFQLETTSSLQPLAATVLNVTPDHMDRYDSIKDYVRAKHRIFQGAQQIIINKHDPFSQNDSISQWQKPEPKKWYFGLESPKVGEWGIRVINNEEWLAFGNDNLMPVSLIKLRGEHNLANALSGLALGHAIGLPINAMLETLQHFSGLDHRCQWVAQYQSVEWFNDSKGTNTGACIAALIGLGTALQKKGSGKIILLLGGDSKGADFACLQEPIKQYCRLITVMGKDQKIIMDALQDHIEAYAVDSMSEAVEKAFISAQPNDIVLLSPACSSLDQYRDYTHRGEVFMEAVKKVLENAQRC